MYEGMTNADLLVVAHEKAHPKDNPTSENADVIDALIARIRNMERQVRRCESTIEAAKYECFGKLIWNWIKENPEFLGDEFSLTLMPMAENSGLCKHEVYDPEKHGEMEGLVPGEDEIYWWG